MDSFNPPKLQIPSRATATEDELLSPTGRLFVHPSMDTIIHSVIGLEQELDIEVVKTTVKETLLSKQPRFSCLLVRKGTREYWRKTQLNIDRHFIIVDSPGPPKDVDEVVNDYISELSVSRPLPLDKPLWEAHIMLHYRCVIFRIHHALGDGISLMATLMEGCRRRDDQSPVSFPTAMKPAKAPLKGGLLQRLFVSLKYFLFSLFFCFEFIMRSLWLRDARTAISGGEGIELLPRKLATAKFAVDDMKVVKNAIPRGTINDVLVAVVSAGLAKYLDKRGEKRLDKGIRITGVTMVNLRGLQDPSERTKDSKAQIGNKFGILLVPLRCYKSVASPLDFIKDAKSMIDAKKRSFEAHFSYSLGNLVMYLLGPKFAYFTYYKTICNTSFTLSNVMGPNEELTIWGNPIKFMRVSTSSLSHPLTMHMLSYAGRAEMQILVAKDIIPDPEFLAKCFENGLREMKLAALSTD